MRGAFEEMIRLDDFSTHGTIPQIND
jgi:hypothetical protein